MGEEKGHDPGFPSSRVSPGEVPVSRAAAGASSPTGDPEGNRLSFRHRLFLRLAHLWFRLTRGMTLGVRVIALDGEGRIFLVRHSYVPGWHLPGGGIEVGQDGLAAVEAELREEGNLALASAPELIGIYLNPSASRRDHVLLYLARGVHQTAPRLPDREIIEAGFFARDALPPGVTQGTLRRFAEVFEGARRDRFW
jgi:ADP-ribose pyrophosphatase YjhB (NUDIX family)